VWPRWDPAWHRCAGYRVPTVASIRFPELIPERPRTKHRRIRNLSIALAVLVAATAGAGLVHALPFIP